MNEAGPRIAKTSVLHIEGGMTIYQAGDLKMRLASLLKQPGPLEINLAAVAEIDSAGIQLLMLAKRCAHAAEKEFRLVAYSPAVSEAFELLHLGEYFDDPIVIPY